MKSKKNIEVREAIKTAGFFHWQVAEQMGISEYTLVHWLRKDLSKEQHALIVNAIEALSMQEHL